MYTQENVVTFNIENQNLTTVLQIRLQYKRNFDFCKLITGILYTNDSFPYLLKVENPNKILKTYDEIIKHSMSIPILLGKLSENKYDLPNDFLIDLYQMWDNIEIIHGEDSEVAQRIKIIKEDILFAWNSSLEL